MTDVITTSQIEPILDDFLGVDCPHYEELRKRCAQRIVDLFANSRSPSEWRDISTAPRDTKAFSVWVPENQCTFQVSRTNRGLCIFGGDHRDYLDRATHWMPLPAPPQRNEVKK